MYDTFALPMAYHFPTVRLAKGRYFKQIENYWSQYWQSQHSHHFQLLQCLVLPYKPSSGRLNYIRLSLGSANCSTMGEAGLSRLTSTFQPLFSSQLVAYVQCTKYLSRNIRLDILYISTQHIKNCICQSSQVCSCQPLEPRRSRDVQLDQW